MPKLTKLEFTPEGEDLEFYKNESSALTPNIIKTIFTSNYFPRLKQLDLSGTNANDNWFSFLEQQTFNSSL